MKKSVNIIGGGPAGLALAAHLDSNKFDITVYEKNKSFGRKFLVAGKGGFNLTHSETIDKLITRYTPPDFLNNALLKFDNLAFRKWLDSIGIPTIIGSSKRVYPETGIKPIEVLNTIIDILKEKGVSFKYDHCWNGWCNENNLLFNKNTYISGDYNVFALGGGSWKVTGSNNSWLSHFVQKKISATPFIASNCGYRVDWSNTIIQRFEGSPLKNITISSGSKTQIGEAVITKFGLEGNAIYGLSPEIRNQFKSTGSATIYIDLKPTLKLDDIISILLRSTAKISDTLKKKLKLSSPMIALLKTSLSKESYMDVLILAKNIKALPIKLTGTSPVDEAISTVGGIPLSEIDDNFQLYNQLNNYCIGEMLDWDAPTGGYLLQGCFSMGVHLAQHFNEK